MGMTIGQVATKTGVRTSALRFYEKIGILPPVPRVRAQRRYDEQLLRMIEVLGFAQRAGFTLDEIRTLFHASPGMPLGERWKGLADQKLVELDRLIEHAKQMKEAIRIGMNCGCIWLDDCMVARDKSRTVNTNGRTERGLRR